MKISRRRVVQAGTLSGLGLLASFYRKELMSFLGVHLEARNPTSLFSFYENSFSDTASTKTEIASSFLNGCLKITEAGHFNIKDDFFYSSYSVSHKVSGDRVNSNRWAIGSFTKTQELLKIAEPVMSSNGVRFKDFFEGTQLIGLGWDFEEKLFKVYSFVKNFNQLNSKHWSQLIKEHQKFDSENFGLVSVSFAEGKPVESKTYLPLRSSSYGKFKTKYPFGEDIIHINLMNTTERGLVPQLDLRPNNNVAEFLNESGKAIIKKYTDFGLPLDTITFKSEQEFTLYFG